MVVDVVANVARVRERIASAGADPDGVTLVAVTKGWPATAVDAAVAAGVHDVGENYAQELVEKARRVSVPPRWHFLGPVQRNKVPALAGLVHLWQGVDRTVVADAIAARAPGAAVLVQVNVAGTAGQHGCTVPEAPALVAHARSAGLDVRGLMAVGPPGPAEAARPAFRLLADIGRELGVADLSMGMSADLEVAVQEGATIVRTGTALFGPRSVRPEVRR